MFRPYNMAPARMVRRVWRFLAIAARRIAALPVVGQRNACPHSAFAPACLPAFAAKPCLPRY